MKIYRLLAKPAIGNTCHFFDLKHKTKKWGSFELGNQLKECQEQGNRDRQGWRLQSTKSLNRHYPSNWGIFLKFCRFLGPVEEKLFWLCYIICNYCNLQRIKDFKTRHSFKENPPPSAFTYKTQLVTIYKWIQTLRIYLRFSWPSSSWL